MSSKRTIIAAVAVIMMAATFAGVFLADDAESDAAPDTYKASYVVNGTTYVKTSSTASIVLETLTGLGATAPEGVAFDKWQIGEETYNAGSTYVFQDTEPIEVKPVWKAIEYSAVFMDGATQIGDPVRGAVKTVDGDSIDDKTPIALTESAPADLTKDGFIFLGWVAEGAAEGTEPVKKAELPVLTADVTYTAVWMVDYRIMFVDGDKTNTMKVSTVVTPDEGTREGFVFLGWYIGTEQIADPAAYALTVEADTTFTAMWEPVIINVTFVAGETVLAVQPVQYGQKVNEPVVTFPAGYSGWDFDFNTVIKADTTVNALVAQTVYKVTFVIEGNSTVTDSKVMQIPEASKEGNSFVGWAVDGEIVDLAVYEIAADVTFTAVFEPFVYTVTFMDGDMVVTTQTVKHGDLAVIPKTAFIGWQTKTIEVVPAPEGAPEGTEPTEKTVVEDFSFSTPVTGDLVLYGVPYVEEPVSPYTMTFALIGSIFGLIAAAFLVSKWKKGGFHKKEKTNDGTNGGAY